MKRVIVALLLFALCFSMVFVIRNEALERMPSGIVWQGGTMDFDVLEEAAEGAVYRITVTGVSRFTGYAVSGTDPSRTWRTELVLTDERYNVIFPMSMAEGAFFHTEPEQRANTRDVVISDVLAVQIFGTEQAVGSTFLLGGTEVTVVGVYRTDRSLAWRLASDGTESVYVPFYTDAASVSAVEEVYAAESSGPGLDRFLTLLDGALAGWQTTDLSLQRRLVEQRTRLTCFFCGVLGASFLLWALWKVLRRDVLCLKECSQNGRWWASHALLWAAFLGGSAVILWSIPFELLLPEPLTETNILRPSFYIEYWISSAQHLRRSPGGAFALTVWNLQALWGALSFVFLAHVVGACKRLVIKNISSPQTK